MCTGSSLLREYVGGNQGVMCRVRVMPYFPWGFTH